VWISRPDQQATGARMWISQLTRIRPRALNPSVKNYHWLGMDMAQLEACDRHAQLVVLRDLSGAIREGPGFNVFACRHSGDGSALAQAQAGADLARAALADRNHVETGPADGRRRRLTRRVRRHR
jgi:branched-subunit amino acid aminotransferase/4-amino-4-deoxychorismate lyase